MSAGLDHGAGDESNRLVAGCLSERLHGSDGVVRLSRGRILVCIEGVEDTPTILGQPSHPRSIAARPLCVQAVSGVTMHPDDGAMAQGDRTRDRDRARPRPCVILLASSARIVGYPSLEPA